MQQIRPASFPQVNNVLLTLADTEYTFKLDPQVRRFLVRARESVSFNLSFKQDDSGTNYLSIHSSEEWTEEEVWGDVTLYIQSSSAMTTIEVLQWIEK